MFRQVVKELPDLSQFFFDKLVLRSKRPGPSRLLVEALCSLGWVHVGDGAFMDDVGRAFHVCLMPFDHVKDMLLSTWTDKVASQVRHRKILSSCPMSVFPRLVRSSTCCPQRKACCCNNRLGLSLPVNLSSMSTPKRRSVVSLVRRIHVCIDFVIASSQVLGARLSQPSCHRGITCQNTFPHLGSLQSL